VNAQRTPNQRQWANTTHHLYTTVYRQKPELEKQRLVTLNHHIRVIDEDSVLMIEDTHTAATRALSSLGTVTQERD